MNNNNNINNNYNKHTFLPGLTFVIQPVKINLIVNLKINIKLHESINI